MCVGAVRLKFRPYSFALATREKSSPYRRALFIVMILIIFGLARVSSEKLNLITEYIIPVVTRGLDWALLRPTNGIKA